MSDWSSLTDLVVDSVIGRWIIPVALVIIGGVLVFQNVRFGGFVCGLGLVWLWAVRALEAKD